MKALALSLTLFVAGAVLPIRGATTESIPVSEDYLVRTWEMDDGLPSNRIYDIAQTPDGYLWLGTQGGLVRFDGLNFTAFGTRNSPGLSDDHVYALFVSSDGALWVGQANGRVVRKLRNEFKVVVPGRTPMEPSERVTSFAQTKDGAVWFTYERSGRVSRWREGEVKEFSALDGLPEGNAGWICTDRKDNVWYANSNGCAVYEGRRFSAIDAEAGTGARIASAKQGGIWAARGGRLLRYEATGTQQFVAELGNLSVHGLVEDSTETLWIQTNQSGLVRFGDRGSVRVPIAGASVSVVFEDREKNLWVGRQSGGLNRVRPRHFFLHQGKEGVSEDELYSVAQDEEGRIWLSGRANMLVRATDAQNRHFAPPGGWRSEAAARSLGAGSDGGIWIATAVGLRRWWQDRWTDESASINAASLLVDHSGVVWIATSEGSVLQTGQGEHPVSFTANLGHANVVAEDRDGALWIGTDAGRVFRREHERWEPVPIPDGGAAPVLFIVGDRDHAVWFAICRRLFRWRAGRVKSVPAEAGLPDEDLRSLAVTEEGKIWIGTSRGLFLTERSELEAVLDLGRPSAWLRSFGRDDGVPLAEFSAGNRGAVTRSRDGHLWFATDRGALEIIPQERAATRNAGRVLIEGVTVGGKEVSFEPSSSIAVPPRAGPIRIRYTLPQMDRSEEIVFRYRIKGSAGDDWLSVGSSRIATLAGLPSGQYQFEVQATDGGGRALTSELAVVPFTIAAVWWEKTWCRLAGAAVVCALLALAVRKAVLLRVRARVRRLEQERAIELERTRIARDMHDQLGASLTQIAIASKLLVLDPPDQVANHGREIAAIARRTVESLDEIVWAVDPANDDLSTALDYLVGFAVDFLASAGIASEVHMPEDIPVRAFPARTRHHLFLAVRESLTNVAKHAEATLVRLDLTLENTRLTIILSDNGRGFELGSTRMGASGHANIRARMAEIGGSSEIESGAGRGTRIALSVDLARAESKEAH